MEVLYLLIPVSMLLVLLIACLLRWAIRSGQYDDMDGPAYRILMDEDDPDVPDAPMVIKEQAGKTEKNR